jgi:hypothetical protein
MKNKFIIALFLFTTSVLLGQIKNVSYQLDYNAATKLYDLNLIIQDGEAHKSTDRIQFNAQISFVTPSNVNLEVIRSYMPLVGNRTYDSDQPLSWFVSNYLRDVKALNNNAVYSIAPKMGQTSFYNDLKEGDKIKLFSLEVYPLPENKASVRLFSNKNDAEAKMMEGSDFRNGFTIGGVKQLYNESLILPTYEDPTSDKEALQSAVYPNPAVNNINIDVKSPGAENVGIIIYNIDGKMVKKSSYNKGAGQTTISQQIDKLSPGVYTVTVDAMGQRQEHKVIVINE